VFEAEHTSIDKRWCLQTVESLMVEDMKLRQDTTMLINALGLNNTLTHVDIRSTVSHSLVHCFFSSHCIAFYFSSCIVLFCCTVHYCLFSFFTAVEHVASFVSFLDN